MTTLSAQQFVDSCLPSLSVSQFRWASRNPIAYQIHLNPKVTEVAVRVFQTLGLLAAGAAMLIGESRITLVIIGAAGTLISELAYRALGVLIPPSHSMENHVYKEAFCEGGHLKYHANIPELTITATDGKTAGQAHGFLLAIGITALLQRTRFVMHKVAGMPKESELPRLLDSVYKSLPPSYQEELNGLVEGYRASGETEHLDLRAAVLMHLLADKLHIEPRSAELSLALKEADTIGCTAIIDGTEETGPQLNRNLDWSSLGVMGTWSVVIKRSNRANDGSINRTCELGFPGMLGTLSGMNQHGLVVAMNVCKGISDEVAGLPAVFMNRHCLEECRTVQEVQAKSQITRPIGPYHLSVADPHSAAAIHFYQNSGGTDFVRDWKPNTRLCTTNYRYRPRVISHPTITNSPQREEQLRQYWTLVDSSLDKQEQHRPAIGEAALALPELNNIRTMHHIVFDPKNRQMRVAYDNAWAAKRRPVDVNASEWFSD